RKSELAAAFRYMRARWAALVRCFDDGRLALDNNPAERALRCVAIGRKNDLFAGSDAGGRRAAAMYSLVESAKLNGLNPQHYLADVLARIADHPARRIHELLPWHWQPTPLSLPLKLASSPSAYCAPAADRSVSLQQNGDSRHGEDNQPYAQKHHQIPATRSASFLWIELLRHAGLCGGPAK